MPRPTFAWHRLPNEPGPAYEAFDAYLKLGYGRTVPDAYRAVEGETSSVPESRWQGWSRRHDWEARAVAYDNYMAGVRDRAAEREAARDAVDWHRRRSALLERKYRVGVQAVIQADALLKDHKAAAPGQPGRLSTTDLKRVVETAQSGASLADSAINAVLGPPDIMPGATAADLSLDPAVEALAAKRNEEWLEEQRKKMAAFSIFAPPPEAAETPTPPSPSTPGPSPSPNGPSNSPAAGRTPPTSATGTG